MKITKLENLTFDRLCEVPQFTLVHRGEIPDQQSHISNYQFIP